MIITLIFISFCVYLALFYRTESIFSKPTLEKLVFYREYLLLTMLPYVYYLTDDKYKDHYIYSALGSDYYFYKSAIFAFVFILFFLLTFKFLNPAFRGTLRKVNWDVGVKKLLFFLSIFTFVVTIYFAIVSIKYQAGIIGVFTFSLSEITETRAFLTQSGGFLSFNKIVIKSWIPILSYLYLYLVFTEKKFFSRVDYFFLYLSFVLGLFASVWFFEKSVIVFYLFGAFGVYVFSGGRLSKRLVVFLPIMALSLVSLMFIITYKGRVVDFQYLIDIIIHRATTQSTGAVMAIHYFETHSFLGVTGISSFFSSLFGSDFQSVYSLIADFYVPETAATSGSMSSFVTGDAFGLFGYIGVLLSGVIVGVYYSFFEAMKVSKFLSVSLVGLYGLYFSHFYIASAFYPFLWPVGLIYSVFPFLFFAILSSRFRGKNI